MTTVQQIIQKIQTTHCQKTSSLSLTTNKQYDCTLCQDLEWIYDPLTNSASPCHCQEIKKAQRLIAQSGISKGFMKKTLDNYQVHNEMQSKAKKAASQYLRDFTCFPLDKGHSIAFLGQVGAGKTHLTIAIANALLAEGFSVIYMSFRDAVMKIKQNVMNEQTYQEYIQRYKEAKVLLIDDLFKGSVKQYPYGKQEVNQSDLNLLFEIINHRYLNEAPTIISSEYTMHSLLEFDEGLGTRIYAMAKGRIVHFQGKELNQRLY